MNTTQKKIGGRIAVPTFEGRDVHNWIAMGEQFAKRGLLEQAAECLAVAKRLAAAEKALFDGACGTACDSAELGND